MWRGAYQIEGLKIQKRKGNIGVPFFAVSNIDLSLDWRRLLHMSIVGRVKMTKPELNFVDSKEPAKQQAGSEESWDEVLGQFLPIRIDYFGVRDGRIHFRNLDIKPPIDIYLSDVHVDATNLTNSLEVSKDLVAQIDVSAKAMNKSELTSHISLDPLAKELEFNMRMKVLGLELAALKDFTREYSSIDFEKGTLDIVLELSVSNNRLLGYIKPLFRDFKVLNWPEDKKKGPLEVAKEAVVAATMQLFKNQPKDQFATRIPLEAEIHGKEKQTNIWQIIMGVLTNGFVKAFVPVYDEKK